MKKFYVFAIVALGALAVSTSCKKDDDKDCVSACGESYCEDDYNKEVAEAEKAGVTIKMTWAEYKAEIKEAISSPDFKCEDEE